jgi:hypothetical protein
MKGRNTEREDVMLVADAYVRFRLPSLVMEQDVMEEGCVSIKIMYMGSVTERR